MFISKHRLSSYEGLPETRQGIACHTAFELFRKYVSPGAKVLDLGSSPGALVRRDYV
jgi:hypothetical protein